MLQPRSACACSPPALFCLARHIHVQPRPFAHCPQPQQKCAALGHAAVPALRLCAEPGLSHRHFHHGGWAAHRLRALGRISGFVCRTVWPVIWRDAVAHGHWHGHLRPAQNTAGGLSADDCRGAAVGFRAQLFVADAGPAADRRGLLTGISGLHHVHRPAFPGRQIRLYLRHWHGCGQPGPAVYGHTAGLAGTAPRLAHGLYAAGPAVHAVMAADFYQGT